MTTEYLILTALVLFIIGEGVRTWVDYHVTCRNYKTHDDNMKFKEERIEQLEKKIESQGLIMSAMTKGYDDVGFLICDDGVKRLPKGWREKVIEVQSS